jgi:L-histidine Nalpha-methyltransferase
MLNTFENKTSNNITTLDHGLQNPARLRFIQEVLHGLSGPEKSLSSRYFYDEEGSRIFQEIMQLDEYYLTRSETSILQNRRNEILELLAGAPFSLIDLGSGDGTKTRLLLDTFVEQDADVTYYPVDIDNSILESQIKSLENLPLKVQGVAAEYYDALGWIRNQQVGRKLVLLLGSNIGNFSYDESLRFMQTLWHLLDDNDLLLIGFDLKKDPGVILKAYSDSKGVTARFNLNLLERINRELGADFDTSAFKHHVSYNPVSGACASYLLSTKAQEVSIKALNKIFTFKAWEAIHMEYSHKYAFSDIQQLASESGFKVVRNLTDSRNSFADSLWKVDKHTTR